MIINKRCDWAQGNPLEEAYHDSEWGVPSHDERYLFEMLMLECQVAGLSWATILSKRETFRHAFDHFDAHKMAQYDEAKMDALQNDPGIVRNKLKIKAMVSNAQAYLKMLESNQTLDSYMWGFVNNQPIDNPWDDISQVPASTQLSDDISKDLKKKGFKFVGTVTIYAYLQAVGIVNDHIKNCDVRRTNHE